MKMYCSSKLYHKITDKLQPFFFSFTVTGSGVESSGGEGNPGNEENTAA